MMSKKGERRACVSRSWKMIDGKAGRPTRTLHPQHAHSSLLTSVAALSARRRTTAARARRRARRVPASEQRPHHAGIHSFLHCTHNPPRSLQKTRCTEPFDHDGVSGNAILANGDESFKVAFLHPTTNTTLSIIIPNPLSFRISFLCLSSPDL